MSENQESSATAPKGCSILFVKVRIFEKIVFQHVKDSKKKEKVQNLDNEKFVKWQ